MYLGLDFYKPIQYSSLYKLTNIASIINLGYHYKPKNITLQTSWPLKQLQYLV